MILKRTREEAGVLLTLLVVAAIVTALPISLVGFLAAAATAGVREDLASEATGDVVLRMSLPPTSDSVGQDEAVRDLLLRSFRDTTRAVPIDIDRTMRTERPATILRSDRDAANLTTAAVISIGEGFSDGSIADASELVTGDWPTSAAEVSVQADTAIALGVAVGSDISIGDADVTVSGTWRLRDDYSGSLAGDPLFSAASGVDTAGPVVIDESLWPSLGVDYITQWTITPRIRALETRDLAVIVNAWGALPTAARTDAALDGDSPHRSGPLVVTATRVQGRVDALGAIAPVALIVLSAIAFLTVLELARLLARRRSAETALLSARGLSVWRITASTIVEAGIAAVLGALIGVAVAAGAVLTVAASLGVGGASVIAGTAVVFWLVPLLVFVGTAGMMGFVVGRSASAFESAAGAARAEESGRVSPAAFSSATALIAAMAALATWQLRAYGSPVTASRDGGSQVDPIGVLAPAAVVVALVLVGFAALVLLSRPADRWATTKRFRTATVTRNIGRRVPQLVTPFVLCALACGQLVFAAGYSATWDRAFTVTTKLREGSAVSLTGFGSDLTAQVLDAAARVDGVASVAPVTARDTVIASETASVIAVAPHALREIAIGVEGILDPDTLADAITAPSIEPRIPEGSGEVTLTIATDGFDTPPPVELLLADRDGREMRVAADASSATPRDGSAAADGEQTGSQPRAQTTTSISTVSLAEAGTGPWTVKAVEVAIPASLSATVPDLNPPTVDLRSMSTDAGDEVDLGNSWVSFDVSPGAGPPPPYEEGLSPEPDDPGFDIVLGAVRMRLVPSLTSGGDTIQMPIAVSSSLAERSGLSLGDIVPVDIDPRWSTQNYRIAAIVSAIPGSTDDRAVLVDVGVVQSILVRSYVGEVAPEEAWIGVTRSSVNDAEIESGRESEREEQTATTIALRHALPARVAVESLALDPNRDILSSSRIALWLGALGTALLALFTLAAGSRSTLRTRLGEVLVLRALGVRPGEIALVRGWEVAVVLLAGVVVGMVAGAAATVLTAPQIARSALPDLYTSLPLAARMDVGGLTLVISSFVLAAGVIVIAAARAVLAQARYSAAGVLDR